MTESHSASVMLTSILSRRMPALLTSTWRSPNASTAASTRRFPPSQSVMSSALATASPPDDADLVRNLLGRGPVVARPVDGPAEVVDDDLGAFGREQQRVLAADPSAGPGDDRHPPVERTHVEVPLVILRPSSPSAGPTCTSVAANVGRATPGGQLAIGTDALPLQGATRRRTSERSPATSTYSTLRSRPTVPTRSPDGLWIPILAPT